MQEPGILGMSQHSLCGSLHHLLARGEEGEGLVEAMGLAGVDELLGVGQVLVAEPIVHAGRQMPKGLGVCQQLFASVRGLQLVHVTHGPLSSIHTLGQHVRLLLLTAEVRDGPDDRPDDEATANGLVDLLDLHNGFG